MSLDSEIFDEIGMGLTIILQLEDEVDELLVLDVIIVVGADEIDETDVWMICYDKIIIFLDDEVDENDKIELMVYDETEVLMLELMLNVIDEVDDDILIDEINLEAENKE